ncbi:MAG: hypothetical protein HUJ16_00640, partial [Kangiella sp.]|nr:hypothetical protein [Kangiella sp.]
MDEPRPDDQSAADEPGPFDVNFLVSLALAFIVWFGLRSDVVWTSFLGEADREALQIAFELRVNKTLPGSRPLLFLNLDDSVWQGAAADAPALAYAPRPVLADMIEASFGPPGMPRP